MVTAQASHPDALTLSAGGRGAWGHMSWHDCTYANWSQADTAIVSTAAVHWCAPRTHERS